MVRDLLGLELQDAEGRRGNKVTLQWLRRHFNGQVQETDMQVQIEQKANRGAMGQYSWGSAGLGTLYRGLCHLSELNTKDAGGFFILLQVWAWERLPYLAPGRVRDQPPRQGAALMGR
ncbi:hypothetical protein Vadar_025952 [Vaccinium darrowii]|uniref:Uncharacterized protein n=1 Tax=Vaccinium darrowii TaxID=229202 RepID=A0ACB7XCK7_9ERIC|nr:hypothetical protein Vadar_025952 [Vaccinium darrowii]